MLILNASALLKKSWAFGQSKRRVVVVKFEHDEIKARIHHYLISKTKFLEIKDKMTEDQLRLFVNNAILDLCAETETVLTLDERTTLIRELVSASVSLGPIRPLVEDTTVTEIMINGHKRVYIQRKGKIE